MDYLDNLSDLVEIFTNMTSGTTVLNRRDQKQQVRPVPDHASRIRDVVLVRRIFSSGNPRGSGNWNGEGMGRGQKGGDQFMSNLGPRWTGSYLAKEGFQVSKREWKGSKEESAGGKKNKGVTP